MVDTTAPPWPQLRSQFRPPRAGAAGHAAAGVYRLYSGDGVLLYVGLGADPYQRWISHAKTTGWWASVDHSRTRVDWFPRYDLAQFAETAAIANERPVHNKRVLQQKPLVAEEPSGDLSMTVGEFRKNVTDAVAAVRLLRRSIELTNRGRPAAVVVTAELGHLVRMAGGADAAARIIEAAIEGRRS